MYIDLVDGERRLPDAGDVPVATTTPLTPAIALRPPMVTPTMVTGTAGSDIIDAATAARRLSAGSAPPHFVFANVDLHAATPPPLTHIADYSFIHGDSFDFSALTSAFHGSGVSDASVVRAIEDASGSFATLQLNVTPDTGAGGAHWVNVAQLDGAHAGDDVSVLIDTSAVHAAHLHVGLLV